MNQAIRVGAYGAAESSIKEVIQPQVPLRLPCYDFVPITSLTLGRRLHCWLANALRAKPAFMT